MATNSHKMNFYYGPFHNDVKNKNSSCSVELCMEGVWRGWRFAMIGMKKLQDIFG